MSFYEVMDAIDSFLWGTPFLVFVILVGLYFTLRSGMFTISHFGHVMKHTMGSMTSKEANAKSDKHISPFEAVCVAIGGCVGNGNISGVATAVATGGPGAILWMWLWAFFGMMVKCVETALSCYYRSRDDEGKFYGGTTFFVEKVWSRREGPRPPGLWLCCSASALCASSWAVLRLTPFLRPCISASVSP